LFMAIPLTNLAALESWDREVGRHVVEAKSRVEGGKKRYSCAGKGKSQFFTNYGVEYTSVELKRWLMHGLFLRRKRNEGGRRGKKVARKLNNTSGGIGLLDDV